MSLIQRNGRAVEIKKVDPQSQLMATVYFTVSKGGFLTPTGEVSYQDTWDRINEFLGPHSTP